MRIRMPAVLVVLAAASAVAQAAGPAPKPGDYIADGGWGTLRISPPARDGLPFAIESVGANFHLCSLDGRIVGTQATLEASDADCVVSFAPTADGITVSSTETCREYCGARAGFDGLYLRPAPGCAADAVGATRGGFKRLYDRKRFAEALAALSPLPTTCARTLGHYERAEILNDIAITHYKLGQRDACLRTLAPFEEDAALSDDEVRNHYLPSEADVWLPIIKAARFNLGLCRKKAR
ncbi:MAG: hypothetical protein ABL934_18180 [Lysobacteraceae bacterium]